MGDPESSMTNVTVIGEHRQKKIGRNSFSIVKKDGRAEREIYFVE